MSTIKKYLDYRISFTKKHIGILVNILKKAKIERCNGYHATNDGTSTLHEELDTIKDYLMSVSMLKVFIQRIEDDLYSDCGGNNVIEQLGHTCHLMDDIREYSQKVIDLLKDESIEKEIEDSLQSVKPIKLS